MVVLTEGPGACAWALFHFSLLSRSAALLHSAERIVVLVHAHRDLRVPTAAGPEKAVCCQSAGEEAKERARGEAMRERSALERPCAATAHTFRNQCAHGTSTMNLEHARLIVNIWGKVGPSLQKPDPMYSSVRKSCMPTT